MRTKRQGLIVWFQHMRNLKHIKRQGHLVYASKRWKYAVLYVNKAKLDTIEKKLLRYSFISKVDYSYKQELETDFKETQVKQQKEEVTIGI